MRARASQAMPRAALAGRAALHARLLARRDEIEQAALTRIYAISDPTEAGDPTYLEGLRSALTAAFDYGFAGIASSERNPPQIPPPLLVQARVAARNGVSLDTVLRRYFAGYALLGDFVLEEAEREGIGRAELKGLLQAQAANFDRLLAAVSEEHGRESRQRPETSEARRAKLVGRLLAGEQLDASDLGYDFEGCHIGAVAKGRGAPHAIRSLATAVDRRVLLVDRDDGALWAWLGGRAKLDPAELVRYVLKSWPEGISLAIGEHGRGLVGWRLTHRQAVAALPIALHGPEPFVRYADVALLASMFQDDLLTAFLQQTYLEPLAAERDGGQVLKATVRAYIASGCNVSSTAAALRVNRKTVASRLRALEGLIDSPLPSRVAEVDAALRIEEIRDLASTPTLGDPR